MPRQPRMKRIYVRSGTLHVEVPEGIINITVGLVADGRDVTAIETLTEARIGDTRVVRDGNTYTRLVRLKPGEKRLPREKWSSLEQAEAWMNGNKIDVIRLIRDLPPIEAAGAVLRIAEALGRVSDKDRTAFKKHVARLASDSFSGLDT